MPPSGPPGDPKVALAVALGVVLIVLARWASRTRGSFPDKWLALRVGDVLFTEIAGAFLLGYGLGGLVAQQEAGMGDPSSRIGVGGRFGRFTGSLPFMVGIVAAAIAVLTRIDLGSVLLRGSSPGNGLSNYIGHDARVIARIPAGGFGQIMMRDEFGYPVTAVATAETDLAEETPVRVVGTKGLNLAVAPTSSDQKVASVERGVPDARLLEHH